MSDAVSVNKAETRRVRYEKLRSSLDNERSSFIAHWRDLSDYNLPRRSLFTVSNTNRGEKRNLKIINSTSTLAARTLRSGMMGGITSPARPWFRLSTQDEDLAEIAAVKEWLHLVTKRMQTVFLKSNIYNSLPIVYGDIGVFATAAMFLEEDFEDTIRGYVFPIGSYMIANDEKGKVRVFMREFRLTVRQIVDRFGREEGTDTINWDNISSHVKAQWDRNELETWIDIVHVVHKNNDYKPDGFFSSDKMYLSVYYETGGGSKASTGYLNFDYDRFLSFKGYDYFPILVPRWEVTGEDVYGTECPAMVCLGDVKELQTMEKRKSEAVEKQVRPPMKAPTSMKTQKASILPSDITYVDERNANDKFEPVFTVKPQTDELNRDIEIKEQRISRSFYEDLFLMLATSDRRQITAREIDERHEEKLVALGPVLEQLNTDLLNPLIDITFEMMNRQGMIPDPPEELAGSPLKVEYISIMHQAQKAAGLSGIDRLLETVVGVASIKPDVVDKIDTDQLIDEVGEITGVPPKIIRPDEVVVEIREQAAQAQQAAEQMELLRQGAGAAKDLSQAGAGEGGGLEEMIAQSEAGSPI